MNKKLLLSFAVFAAAFGANAQNSKRGTDLVKPRFEREVSNQFHGELEHQNANESTSQKLSPKRGSRVITDTSAIFYYRRLYASPKTSGIYLVPTDAGKNKDSIELSTAYQIVPNTSAVKVKGVSAFLGSLNPNGASVDVKLQDMTGKTLQSKNLTVAYDATGKLSVYHFVFPQPVDQTSSFIISVEPNDVKDSIYVPTSGAHRNSSIKCNVSGNTLTIVSDPANLGTSFFIGQEIKGAGITAGTKITSYSSTTKAYTLSIQQAAPLTGTAIEGVNLVYKDASSGYYNYIFPKVGNTFVPDFGKAPKQVIYSLYWNSAANKPYSADLTIYPIIEYTWESTPAIDVKCLSDASKNVKVTYSNSNPFAAVRNPLINKMAVYSSYVGYTKKEGFFYSRAFGTNGTFADTADHVSGVSVSYNYTSKDLKNDTIVVLDYVLPYGFSVAVSPQYYMNKILVTGKMFATTTIDPSTPKCYYDKVEDVLSMTAGFAPINGLPKVGDAAGNYTVTDANGCSVGITTNGTIAAAPAKFTWTSTPSVDDAKCFGEKAKVTIKITNGISGTYTGLTQEFATTASAQTKNIVVADPAGCRDTVKNVAIKAAPKAITLDSASVIASNDKKNDGKAIVIAKGGIPPYAYAWTTSVEKNDTIVVGKGKYSVVVTDANGCVAKASVTVAAGTASVEALAITNLSIYPNPVSSELNVSFDAKSAATVELVNIAGQVIASKVANEFVTSFNTASLESGVYFVNIKVAEGIYTQKIVKD